MAAHDGFARNFDFFFEAKPPDRDPEEGFPLGVVVQESERYESPDWIPDPEMDTIISRVV